MTNGHGRNGHANGVSNGNNSKVGVHSFTEEQINNSITLCADGDFLDISDEEFLSDEKFPGDPPKSKNNHHQQPMNGRNNSAQHHNHHQSGSSFNHNQVTILRRSDSARRSYGKATELVAKLSLKQKPKDEDYEDFVNYKKAYYKEKLGIDPTPEEIGIVVQEYVRALQWNLHYYYHGCKSWGWYYPYHYAPFISDVMNFRDVDTKFEMGEPFKPFDQLLSVLPAASSTLLPKLYRSLVTSTTSPLAKYFPTEVEYDLNGKQNDWEAVVLAPFIDEAALLKASVVTNLFLSAHEREVNSHGPHLMFYYEPASQKTMKNVNSSRSLHASASAGRVRCDRIDKNGFLLPIDKIKFGLLAPPKSKSPSPSRQHHKSASKTHDDNIKTERPREFKKKSIHAAN